MFPAICLRVNDFGLGGCLNGTLNVFWNNG